MIREDEEFDFDEAAQDEESDADLDTIAGETGRKNYITPLGFKKLKEEYHRLFSVERPKLVETIAWAASNGDRSENADYIYGKRRLREIDRRLRFLGRRMAMAVVVDPAQAKIENKAEVLFGARVTVKDEKGKIVTYHIVGEDEIDLERRKISWVSPIAKALLGKKVGDSVSVQRPQGEVELDIAGIEYKAED